MSSGWSSYIFIHWWQRTSTSQIPKVYTGAWDNHLPQAGWFAQVCLPPWDIFLSTSCSGVISVNWPSTAIDLMFSTKNQPNWWMICGFKMGFMADFPIDPTFWTIFLLEIHFLDDWRCFLLHPPQKKWDVPARNPIFYGGSWSDFLPEPGPRTSCWAGRRLPRLPRLRLRLPWWFIDPVWITSLMVVE